MGWTRGEDSVGNLELWYKGETKRIKVVTARKEMKGGIWMIFSRTSCSKLALAKRPVVTKTEFGTKGMMLPNSETG
jgi:hypothetical protein